MASGTLTKAEIVPGLILDTETEIYPVPANQRLIHVDLSFCNIDGSTEQIFDLHFVPQGGTRGNSNYQVKGVMGTTGLLPGQPLTLTRDPMMGPGGKILAIAPITNKICYQGGVVLEEL